MCLHIISMICLRFHTTCRCYLRLHLLTHTNIYIFLKPNSLYDITLPQINSWHPKNGWKPIGISEIPGVFFRCREGATGVRREGTNSWREDRPVALRGLPGGSFEAKTKLQVELYVHMGVSYVCMYIYISYIYIYMYMYIYIHTLCIYMYRVYIILYYISFLKWGLISRFFFVSVPTPMWHPMVLPWLPWQDIKEQRAGFCVMGFAGRKGATSQLLPPFQPAELCLQDGGFLPKQKGI